MVSLHVKKPNAVPASRQRVMARYCNSGPELRVCKGLGGRKLIRETYEMSPPRTEAWGKSSRRQV